MPRDCGDDEFVVNIARVGGDDPAGHSDNKKEDENNQHKDKGDKSDDGKNVNAAPASSPAAVRTQCSIVDRNDGTYVVTFTAPAPGSHEISVEFADTFNGVAGHVRGSPFAATFNSASSAHSSASDDTSNVKCLPPSASAKDLESPELLRRIMAAMNKRNGEFRRLLVELRKEIPSSEAEGLDTLGRVKEILRKLEVERDANRLVLDQAQQFFAQIKRAGNGHVDKEFTELEHMEKLYLDVEKQVPATEQRIQAPTRAFGEKTEHKVAAYETTIAKKLETLRTLDFWSAALEPERALDKIAAYLVDWDAEMRKCEELTNLCAVFGFPQ